MSMSVLMPMSEEPRRFEVFTGEGRRRRFSASEKAAIVAESYEDGVSVCALRAAMAFGPRNCSPGVATRVPGWMRRLSRRCLFRPLWRL